MAIITTQIRTLALLNAGYASEVQNTSSYALGWAMTYTPSGGPDNNSGYSVGTLQSDFGQRPHLVPGLVSAYYNWAGSDPSKLLGRTALELTSVMEQQGRLGLVPYANSADMSRRPLSSEERAKFNAFMPIRLAPKDTIGGSLTRCQTLPVVAEPSFWALTG